MNDSRTVWVGNITDQVTEELLYEIFLQAGPLERVTVRSHPSGTGFGFVTFKHEESVPYAVELFQDLKLFGMNINIKPRTGTLQNRQGSMRRSGGYVDASQPNEHTRFEQSADLEQQMNLENLVRLGQIMNVGNSAYPESYDEPSNYHDYEFVNGRDRFVDGDRERSHRHFERPGHVKNRNHQRSHYKKDHYNRNRGRRHQPF